MKWRERWERNEGPIVVGLGVGSVVFILLFCCSWINALRDQKLNERERAFEKRLIEGITTAITAVRGEINE